MSDRTYTKELLNLIKCREYVVQEDGMEILIKPIPETDEPGAMDPRFYESIAPMTKGVKGALIKTAMKLAPHSGKDILRGAQQMRRMMNGVKSIPIINTVQVREHTVENGDYNIPIRIYTPKQKREGLVPIFYYIHGGGFVAGSMEVVDEMCKMITELTGCISIQPEYRLAPENPFPTGLNDCYEVLKWIYANAEELGGDYQKICISGDSAGGNLATVCAMRDRDEKAGMVKIQALLYPTVDAAHMTENMVENRKVYEVSDKYRKLLFGMLDMMGGAMGSPTILDYLSVKESNNPYVSPYLGNLEKMPDTLILLGEYDFLRVENDRYGKKLLDSGVKVKMIRYKGLSHGFADQIGVTPQAEDAMMEIADFMNSQLN